ncbi:MAG: aldehyde dehydrogenase EutE [Erysipelothrix sp.]|jgi:propionaldehyde dehydrogenase|nr:aldehyde dehydrogenase EutE [Erysipelothrix sp.]
MSQITQRDIEIIVESVMKNVERSMEGKSSNVSVKALPHQGKPSATKSQLGVFQNAEDAILAAHQAYLEYSSNYRLEDRRNIVEAIRQVALTHLDELAQLTYEETNIGRLEDKKSKIFLAATKTPGTEDLTTSAISGDYGLTIEERAPFGVIGVVTPVTNPVETIINNSISMLAAGNAVVYNVHPSSKSCTSKLVNLINQQIQLVNGPANLITMIANPTLESLDVIMNCPKVALLVGTGGPRMVKTLLQSGKKAIGAGAGNPPVIVDETADIEAAAKAIIEGTAFDNNILCIGEKEVFCLSQVYDNLIYHMLKNKAYFLSKEEINKIKEIVLTQHEVEAAKGCSLTEKKKEYHVSKDWVGKDAQLILKAIGVNKKDINLLIFEAEFEDPFVQLEQMMPILPIVKVKTFEEAVQLAVKAEHGNRHTASIFSKNIDRMTQFARAIQTTIFVKNAATLAGVGYKGEGHTTFTIAGPTGEGVTSAKTFTRIRRCTLAEGGFRIM